MFCVFQGPSDPISPKDNPTRDPYPPKHPDGKNPFKNNDVLEKPGELTLLLFTTPLPGKVVIESRIYGCYLAFGNTIAELRVCVCVALRCV